MDQLNDPPASRPLAFPATVIVLVMAAILVLAVVLSLRVAGSNDAIRAAAAEAEDEVDATTTVLDALQDAETGQRGFLLTMRPAYLEPYQGAPQRLDTALAQLDRLAAGSPWLRTAAAELRDAAKLRMAVIEQSIFLARTRGQRAALDGLLSETGRSSMDAARRLSAQIIGSANAERERRSAELAARERRAIQILFVAAGSGGLLLGLASLRLLASRNRLARAQQALTAQTARLQGTVDHIRDGIAVFDPGGRLLLWNRSFFPRTGLPDTLARPGMPLTAFAGAAGTWSPPLLEAATPSDAPHVSEIHRDGRVLEVWRSRTPEGGQMIAVADITRRIEAEAIARQAQKMQALGQMTGGVAHDFNNLLQVVSANLELMSPRVSGDGWLRPRLAAAQAGVERGARLVRHLLAFARRTPLAPESVAPEALLHGLEDMLRRTLGEGVEVRLLVEAPLWPVLVDPHQLETAMLNLAFNGRDAMRGVGVLTIAARNAAPDGPCSDMDATAGQFVEISVTDTGIGMTPEETSRAIEPFYTTKSEGRGTGLGLSMVYGFAKQSGGNLRLDSEPGRGTTATLCLPRSVAPSAPPPAPEKLPPRADGETVLVVEDDPAVRQACVATLRSLGYAITEADSAAAALALLTAGAAPDLLFTDVVMPGEPSARVLAERARAMLPALAVVFTTGYTDSAIVHDFQLDAGVQLIAKPWRTEDLARGLRAALAARGGGAGGADAAPPGGLRIVLAEDDDLVRGATAEALAGRGHIVREAQTGDSALRILADGACDLLITDIGLPDMDGHELARRARIDRPNLAVVMASGQERGASGDPSTIWLTKPFDTAALRGAIARATGEG